MTDPNEALVEELADAIRAVDDPGCELACAYARAILPIIARVRDEAFNEGTIDGLDWRNEL